LIVISLYQPAVQNTHLGQAACPPPRLALEAQKSQHPSARFLSYFESSDSHQEKFSERMIESENEQSKCRDARPAIQICRNFGRIRKNAKTMLF
jgi:hypothetical protein